MKRITVTWKPNVGKNLSMFQVQHAKSKNTSNEYTITANPHLSFMLTTNGHLGKYVEGEYD